MDTKTIIYNIYTKMARINWLARYKDACALDFTGIDVTKITQDFTQYAHENLIGLPDELMSGVDDIAGGFDHLMFGIFTDTKPETDEKILNEWMTEKTRIDMVMWDLYNYYWSI